MANTKQSLKTHLDLKHENEDDRITKIELEVFIIDFSIDVFAREVPSNGFLDI